MRSQGSHPFCKQSKNCHKKHFNCHAVMIPVAKSILTRHIVQGNLLSVSFIPSNFIVVSRQKFYLSAISSATASPLLICSFTSAHYSFGPKWPFHPSNTPNCSQVYLHLYLDSYASTTMSFSLRTLLAIERPKPRQETGNSFAPKQVCFFSLSPSYLLYQTGRTNILRALVFVSLR